MKIKITQFTDHHIESVADFNERLKSGGLTYQFPTRPEPKWLPPRPGTTLYQEYFVAVDPQQIVRGGYILKHQDFKIGDEIVSVGDFQLPLSEGTVDRAYAGLAVELLFDVLKKKPLLYGLGIGGHQESVARLFKAARWHFFTVPFFFKVNRPARFFRKIRFLRNSPARCVLLDLAALTGIGWLGVKGIQAFRNRRAAARASLVIEEIDEFGEWVDRLWAEARDEYRMIAVRNGEVLRTLYPKEDSRFIRLRVSENGRPIGWVVMLDTQLADHRQFAAMRLGSVVDAFGSRENAAKLVGAATAHLERRGVDLIVSNQSHVDWCAAFDAAGYFRGPSNYLFAGSRKLAKAMEAAGIEDQTVYINRGDGDGPINL